MLGRSIITNPLSWKGCYTFPVMKTLGANGELQLLPMKDPDFGIANEAAFAAGVTIPAILVFIAVGVIWSCIASRNSKKTESQVNLKELN